MGPYYGSVHADSKIAVPLFVPAGTKFLNIDVVVAPINAVISPDDIGIATRVHGGVRIAHIAQRIAVDIYVLWPHPVADGGERLGINVVIVILPGYRYGATHIDGNGWLGPMQIANTGSSLIHAQVIAPLRVSTGVQLLSVGHELRSMIPWS